MSSHSLPTDQSRSRNRSRFSSAAFEHFSQKLTFETIARCVFVLPSNTVELRAPRRSGRQAYSKGHVSGAINIPLLTNHWDRMKEYSPETVFVVYCTGPHCNGANKAAMRSLSSGVRLKEIDWGSQWLGRRRFHSGRRN